MFKNEVVCGDNLEVMRKMPDESVHAVITSPPYFVNMPYETIKKGEDIWRNWNRYMDELLYPTFREAFRLLKPGGHLWINIDDSHTSVKSELKKNIALPTHAALTVELSKYMDYKEMVLWKKIRGKKTSGGSGMMMGSFGRFGSPGSIPIVQEVEYILWFKKPGLRKDLNDKVRKGSALSKEEFKEWGMQIWNVQPARAKSVGHPAPFPIEIPRRCIKLSTFKGDTILDPFGGASTTALAAIDTERNYTTIDLDPEYCKLGEKRIADFIEERDNPLQPELPFESDKKKTSKKKVIQKRSGPSLDAMLNAEQTTIHTEPGTRRIVKLVKKKK